jgi:Zn-dependent metalloprotease
VIVALLLAASFAADFPQAETTVSKGRLTRASNFEARGLGDTPQAAAAAFLAEYGDAFGISPQQKLVLRGGGTAVHFERQIDGLPIFGADVVVGIGAGNSVILVNGGDVPPVSSGTFRYSRKAATSKALKAVKGASSANETRAVKGWKASGDSVRPVWRVELTTDSGDWRLFVDAETGAILSRNSLRQSFK